MRILLYLLLTLNFFAYTELSSYSLRDGRQYPIDHKLVALLNTQNGLFIEVGALDGMTQSNTKLLEECFDWRGLLIEPSLKAYKQSVVNRPLAHTFHCALGSHEQNGSIIYGDFDGNPMASIHGNRLHRNELCAIPIRSLQSILDELNMTHVDFFLPRCRRI